MDSRKKSAEHYLFGKVIGEGSFSTVYLAKESETGNEYAIKVCEKTHIIKERKQEYIKREKLSLAVLNNAPGIISLSCTFQDTKRLFFVLTYAANGEILKYINASKGLSIECAKFYSAELVLAIEEMHRKNIIHRDLKPENLLLDHNMHLMIADFGSSKILPENYEYDMVQAEIERARIEEEASNESDEGEENERSESSDRRPQRRPKRRASFVGTAQYVSPEILKGNAAHLSTDLWAFGCILYQMISGVPPFKGQTEYLIFQKILSGDLEFPEGFDADAKDLISKLLVFNPKERLGSEDSAETRYHSVRSHRFFEGINWTEILNQKPPQMANLPNDNDDSENSRDIFSNIVETGLGQQREFEIMRMNFVSANVNETSINRNRSQSPPNSSSSIERLLEEQRSSKWSSYVEKTELILKHGFVNKKKGLFARKRMLLLTNHPRLIYIDEASGIKKGEIPFDSNLFCEARNFKIFFVHTPNRIYYLEDVLGGANEWCEAIERAKRRYIRTINDS